MTYSSLRLEIPAALLALVLCTLAAPSAKAIGLNAGGELGGHVGAAQILGGGYKEPVEAGAQTALTLRLEFYDQKFIRLQAIGRLELTAFGVFGPAGAGAGGGGALEGLLRAGLHIPLFPVEPFVEAGGGLAVGGGAGTTNLTGVSAAADGSINGFLTVPAGYAGVGIALSLPLLPWFEIRVGTHGGYPLPTEKFDALSSLPSIPLPSAFRYVGRAEINIGMGYGF